MRGPLLAGAAFSLAFLAKQSAAMVVGPMVLYLVVAERARCAVLVAALATGIGGGSVVLDRIHDGWFRYFLFETPLRHPMDPGLAAAYWPHDLLLPLGLAMAIAAAYFVVPAWTRGTREASDAGSVTDSGRGFHAAMFAGTALSSWFHRMYPGGYDNVLMPVHATIAILFGLGVHAGREWIAGLRTPVRGRLVSGAWLAIVLQFAALGYDPRRQLPTAADRDAGDRFVERLHTVPGRVLIPSQPYLVRRAGKPDHFHEMALIGLLETSRGATEVRLAQDLERAVRDTSYTVVVLGTRGWLGNTIRIAYDPVLNAFPDSSVFWPVTGMRTRPEYVYLPRRAHPAP